MRVPSQDRDAVTWLDAKPLQRPGEPKRTVEKFAVGELDPIFHDPDSIGEDLRRPMQKPCWRKGFEIEAGLHWNPHGCVLLAQRSVAPNEDRSPPASSSPRYSPSGTPNQRPRSDTRASRPGHRTVR